MISRTGLKRGVAQVVLVLGALLAVGLVVVGARVVVGAQTGADRAGALHAVPELPPDADRLVTWDPDGPDQGRALEPATRTALEAAYVRAWAAIGAYQSTGETDALTATLSGPARLDALAAPRTAPAATWSVSHRLALRFYALDGATAAFTDLDARLVRTVGEGAGETVVDARETYAVVMVLEDGYWRVRQLRRDAADPPVTVAAPGPTVATGLVPVDPRPAPAGRAVEYRPDWASVGPARAAADLARVRALGLDAVRLPLPFAELGGPVPDPAVLQRVSEVLAAATDAGVTVVPVLLDGLADLSPGRWAAVDEHVGAVVGALAGSPAVVAWDAVDRPDLRTGPATPAEVRALALHAAALVRATDPAHPVAVSWADPQRATDPVLAGQVDVVGWHPGAVDDGLADALAGVVDAAGRPVALVATTSGRGASWSPVAPTPAGQARQVAAALDAAARAGVAWTSVDTLQDTATDQHGLLRADGTATPAAAVAGGGVAPADVPGPGVLDRLRTRFWLALALLVAGGLVAAGAWRRRDELRGLLRRR